MGAYGIDEQREAPIATCMALTLSRLTARSSALWAIPRITLEFTSDGRCPIEKTLLCYARDYEQTVSGSGPGTFADDGIIRFTVSCPSNERSGASQQEWIAARGAGARQGDQAKLDKALAQLHKCARFVMVSSGESLESLLAGKFREILQTVIRETCRPAFEQAERRRAGYVEGLQRTEVDLADGHRGQRLRGRRRLRSSA